jgi:hypothetical protein
MKRFKIVRWILGGYWILVDYNENGSYSGACWEQTTKDSWNSLHYDRQCGKVSVLRYLKFEFYRAN